MVNMELVDRVFETIEANQDQWDQVSWASNKYKDGNACGTIHCFGGWALELSGRVKEYGGTAVPIDENGDEAYSWSQEAAKVLGFNEYLGSMVFYNLEIDFNEFRRQTYEAIALYGALSEAQAQALPD